MINRLYNLSKKINLFLTIANSEYQILAYYLNKTKRSRVAKNKRAKIK